MEAALVGACEVPLEIMRTCAEAIDLIETFAEKGSKIAISDAGVGATLLKSALQGASLNIYINTKSMADKEAAASYNKEADMLREKYEKKRTKFFNLSAIKSAKSENHIFFIRYLVTISSGSTELKHHYYMEVPMAKLLSGKEVTASLNEEIRKKQNCSLHITSHQNSASSALEKEKMTFLTSAGPPNDAKHSALPTKSFCFRKMPQRKWF